MFEFFQNKFYIFYDRSFFLKKIMYYNAPLDTRNLHEFQFLFKKVGQIERRILLKKGTFIDKYEIEECIGRGGYGDIYGAKIPGKSKVYALKLEDKQSEKNEGKDPKKLSLNKEIQCIKELQDSLDIPRFIDSGETDRYLYYVMELLGPSLSTVRKELSSQKFTLSTTLRVGIKMLRIIQHVHRHGYIHCDVKPSNFLLRPDCLHFLVLSDFGLMRRYVKGDDTNGSHIEKKLSIGFNGTRKYASPNSLDENTLSRKDDLVSWLYSLYEMKNGYLPWSTKKKDEMKQMKSHFTAIQYFNTMPSEVQDVCQYITSLDFDEEPNYDWIVDSLLKAMNRLKIKTTDPFDWEGFSDNHILMFSPIAELPKATWCRVQNPKPVLSMPGKPNYKMIKNRIWRFCLCCSFS